MGQPFIIEPGSYVAFESEAELIDKCKEWGLLSDKASKSKTFLYKGFGQKTTCAIVGYVDRTTAVIEFEDSRRHCIHPSYLKEMQASTFGQRASAVAEESAEGAAEAASDVPAAAPEPERAEPESPRDEQPDEAEAGEDRPEPAAAPKTEAKKGKAAKLQLPEDKVGMVATVKEFTTVPNPFSDSDDEVVIYEPVSVREPEIELGTAWSSYSATLKKAGLAVGDTIAFEAKVIAKKLTKHPVPYKINNPSKIQKQ